MEKYKITIFFQKSGKKALYNRKMVSNSKKNIILERFKQSDIFVFRFFFNIIQRFTHAGLSARANASSPSLSSRDSDSDSDFYSNSFQAQSCGVHGFGCD